MTSGIGLCRDGSPGFEGWRSRWLIAALLAATVASGCQSRPRKPGTIAVRGTVRLEGRPLQQGSIHFSAAGGSISEATRIGDAGRFGLDLAPGTYAVAVISVEGQPRVDRQGNPIPAKPLIPPRYFSITTSGLELVIDAAHARPVLDLQP